MATERKQIDWESVEDKYRAGVLSIREIARHHDCTDAAIRKRAKELGWDRDLTAKIAAQVRDKLVRSEVRSERNATTERELIEVNAEAILRIRLEHRQDIGRAKRLTASLFTELTEAGMVDADKPLALPARVDCGKKLADTLKTLVTMEREAWGIDGPEKSTAQGMAAILEALQSSERRLPCDD